MMTMLYPYIMAEFGMTYRAVGVLSAICSVLSSICQGAYSSPAVSSSVLAISASRSGR